MVVGGGNICRGLAPAPAGMDRATGDYMGMLATVLNALALQDALEKLGADTRVQSAITISEVAEPYIRAARSGTWRRAGRDLRGGHRQPVFTTTPGGGAARARDPRRRHPDGQEWGRRRLHAPTRGTQPRREVLQQITHREAIERGLSVMDSTALSLCMDNSLPIHVFNMDDERNIERIVSGERVGTVVST